MSDLSSVLNSLDLPADWIGVRSLKSKETRRAMRDGLPTQNGVSVQQGAMVEVLVEGQFGYAATNVVTPDAIHRAAQMAYQQAKSASQWRIHDFTPAVRPKVTGQYVSPCVKPLDALSAAEINEILHRLCESMRVSDQIVQATATAIANETETWFVSSNGSDVYQKFWLVEAHCGVTAQDGRIVQQRSNNGYLAHSYQGGWEQVWDDQLWARSRQIGEQAVTLLTAPDCPTETTTLVLAPDQMMLQIHESVGHPLELDRILGDERNYAGGSFVKPTDFGQLTYGSELMNITFSPQVSHEFASYDFDDTGVPAEPAYLIRQGRLQRGLGSLESQTRLGVPGVACARASSWNRPAIDRMANINLEAGESCFEDMIAKIDRGVFMETNRSWSIDDQRFKFQFGCEYAQLIENGKLTTPLRNPNYRATTPHFWRNLVQVGDRHSWKMYGTPFCGKGEPNQIIRVGHGAPICAFANIEVFGGDA